ncbi:hypothetical protein IAT40_006706 [Kwoniella sp. CBS 6097]
MSSTSSHPSGHVQTADSAMGVPGQGSASCNVQVPTNTFHDYSAFTSFARPARRDADWQLLRRVMNEASEAETVGANRIAQSYADAGRDALFEKHTDWDNIIPPTQDFLWGEQMRKYKGFGDAATTRYIDSVRATATEMYSSWNPPGYRRPQLTAELMAEITHLPDHEPTLEWIEQLEDIQEREVNSFFLNLSQTQSDHATDASGVGASANEDFADLEWKHEMQRRFVLKVADENLEPNQPQGLASESRTSSHADNPYGEGRA